VYGNPTNPAPQQPPEAPRHRRRRFRIGRLFRWIFTIVVCLAIAFVVIRIGPSVYRRFFGDGNTVWVSERFGEVLKEKNELVVLETTLTGQETVSQKAWLIGTVQQVQVPYSFTISFAVDLSLAQVSVDNTMDSVVVRLPAPVAKYPKLTVDEDNMKKIDWLYPLTPERYAEIKNEIEEKLTAECSSNQEYLNTAWQNTMRNMESLFTSVTSTSEDGVTCTVEVVKDNTLTAPETTDETAAETVTDTETTALPNAA